MCDIRSLLNKEGIIGLAARVQAIQQEVVGAKKEAEDALVGIDAVKRRRSEHANVEICVSKPATHKGCENMSHVGERTAKEPHHCTASSRFLIVPRTISALRLSASFETYCDSIGSCWFIMYSHK